jgi:hypothetical protein
MEDELIDLLEPTAKKEPKAVVQPPPEIDAYGYLEGVLQRRWPYEPELARCARDLLPYQRPKLSVQVQVNSFAEDLEAAIQRRLSRATNGMKVIEAKPIEAKPVESFKRRI